ncbi:MAG: sulfotransferase [Sedimenticola sp.]
MPFPSNLFIIGAQKAGTTFLATLLSQHPDIDLCSPKEPDFFTRHWSKGMDWYRDRFSDTSKKYLLDASTSYSAAPLTARDNSADVESNPLHGVPERIFSVSPDARFIYLMRDPVKRTYSSYWHSVRGGYENRSLDEALQDPRYLEMGHYYQQLELYYRLFPKERFLVLFFEDFIKSPEATANRCFEFLGLDGIDEFSMDGGKNETYVPGPVLSRVNSTVGKYISLKSVYSAVTRVIPKEFIRTLVSPLIKPVPSMTEKDREKLARHFAAQNRLLETELGLSLPGWTKSSE